MTRKDSFIMLLQEYCNAYHPFPEPHSQVNNLFQAMRLLPDCIPLDILYAVTSWVEWRVQMAKAIRDCSQRPEPPSWVKQMNGVGVYCDDM